MVTQDELYRIAGKFDLDQSIDAIDSYGDGHIHRTYLVQTSAGSELDNYILQQINHQVFPNIKALMRNTQLVTAHMIQKLAHGEESGLEIHSRWRVPKLIPTLADRSAYDLDIDGTFWRMFEFIPSAIPQDTLSSPQQAHATGEAFAFFQYLLQDLSSAEVVEVIPDFHHVEKRLEALEQAIRDDKVGRLHQVSEALSVLEARKDVMAKLLRQRENGELPVRIIHNDTKFNNALLDEQERAIAVIDLDTVMPGLIAYDFGDAIRTTINKASEDEEDVRKIQLNLDYFASYLAGYARIAKHFLEDREVDSLMDGVLLLPYMQAVRFMTDYLEGDVYFKIQRPEHNLHRANAQIKLLLTLESHQNRLKSMIDEVFSKGKVK